MTRARQTLTLYQLEGLENPHTSELKGTAVQQLKVGTVPGPSDDELRKQYALLDLASVWIDYPAISQKSRAIRELIAKLQTGSEARLRRPRQGSRVSIENSEGHKIGFLSEAASREWENRLGSVVSTHIHSIIKWRREFSERTTHGYPDEWEVPLLEAVWVKKAH